MIPIKIAMDNHASVNSPDVQMWSVNTVSIAGVTRRL